MNKKTKEKMKQKLKISNIVFSGRMPFFHKIREMELINLIIKSNLNWQLINEEMSPIIRRFVEKEGLSNAGRKKNAHISIWTSGAIVITGVTSRKEAMEYYNETIKDLKKYCGGCFKK